MDLHNLKKMIELMDLLCDSNIENACQHLLRKKDTCGNDGMYLSELSEYLDHNKSLLLQNLRNGDYEFSVAGEYIVLRKNGKRQEIIILNPVDL
jgi:hypothetical protein